MVRVDKFHLLITLLNHMKYYSYSLSLADSWVSSSDLTPLALKLLLLCSELEGKFLQLRQVCAFKFPHNFTAKQNCY